MAVLAGELLREAELLVNQRVHPMIIIAGFRRACEIAQEVLAERSFDNADDPGTLLPRPCLPSAGFLCTAVADRLAASPAVEKQYLLWLCLCSLMSALHGAGRCCIVGWMLGKAQHFTATVVVSSHGCCEQPRFL